MLFLPAENLMLFSLALLISGDAATQRPVPKFPVQRHGQAKQDRHEAGNVAAELRTARGSERAGAEYVEETA